MPGAFGQNQGQITYSMNQLTIPWSAFQFFFKGQMAYPFGRNLGFPPAGPPALGWDADGNHLRETLISLLGDIKQYGAPSKKDRVTAVLLNQAVTQNLITPTDRGEYILTKDGEDLWDSFAHPPEMPNLSANTINAQMGDIMNRIYPGKQW